MTAGTPNNFTQKDESHGTGRKRIFDVGLALGNPKSCFNFLSPLIIIIIIIFVY